MKKGNVITIILISVIIVLVAILGYGVYTGVKVRAEINSLNSQINQLVSEKNSLTSDLDSLQKRYDLLEKDATIVTVSSNENNIWGSLNSRLISMLWG